MAMVVNRTAGIECKTQWIDVVVAAVEKYLDVQYFTAELQGVLNDNIPSSQSAGLVLNQRAKVVE